MSDFCIETTVIHSEWVEEYNKNFSDLSDRLKNVEFFCVTNKPEDIIKKDNIKVVDIKKYTDTSFTKNYNLDTGFATILQATRYGLYEAYEAGYTKVLHLQTDIMYHRDEGEKMNEEALSKHFRKGVYFELGGNLLNLLYATDRKTKELVNKFDLKRKMERISVGDDPIVFLKLNDKDHFKQFLDNLEILCEETIKHESYTTGLSVELAIAMSQTGTKSYYNYHSPVHLNVERFFDVDNDFLHVRHYEDRDPEMARNLGITV